MRSRSRFLLATFPAVVCILAAATGAEERKPYQYISLKDASDADVLRFMAEGKSEIDRELEAKIKDHLPEDFWTGEAKTAALALVGANRSQEHRATYSLALRNTDETAPPARCTLSFTSFSSRCYNAVDSHYFLRVDPEASYLAYAQSWSGGAAFYNVVQDQPAFNFRLCPLAYEDARKIADVIWWLNRIETKSVRAVSTSEDTTVFTGSASFSTADGFGKLIFRGKGSAPIEISGSRWADYLAERWSGEYEPEVVLNFTDYLIQRALTERLGAGWTKFEPKHPPDFDFDRISPPIYEEEERKRLCDLTSRFLDFFSLDQEKISLAIVAEAARCAGRLLISESADRLRAIEKALPPAGPKRRSSEEVFAALKKLPDETDIRNEEKRKRVEAQRAALEAERDWHLYDRGVNSADHVRELITFALRRLAVANDAVKLQAWALSKSEGMQWAMQRLAVVDKKRYADVLETFTMQSDAKWARQFFDELIKVDAARARAIARRLPATRRDALALAAFQLLREANEMPDEKARLATILQLLQDPKTDWEEQERAIELLVPKDAPMRYPGGEIDQALIKFLDRKRKKDNDNYAVKYACRALARRGHTELFERIAAEFSKNSDAGLYDDVLGALTHLAQADPSRFNPPLAQLVRPHLAATNRSVPTLFWAIWAANLRELQPDLQRLATQDPEEIEDAKAHRSGGDVTPVTGRFHFARKITSLWNEPDSFTLARLYIAFAVAEPYSFVRDDAPERVTRLKAEMLRVSNDLSPEAKLQLAAMLDRIDAPPTHDNPAQQDGELRPKITAFLRQALRL